jgi:hypothetical protein
VLLIKIREDIVLLDPAHEDKDNDDDQHEAEATAGTVTPAAAVAPGRKGTEKEENEDDE